MGPGSEEPLYLNSKEVEEQTTRTLVGRKDDVGAQRLVDDRHTYPVSGQAHGLLVTRYPTSTLRRSGPLNGPGDGFRRPSTSKTVDDPYGTRPMQGQESRIRVTVSTVIRLDSSLLYPSLATPPWSVWEGWTEIILLPTRVAPDRNGWRREKVLTRSTPALQPFGDEHFGRDSTPGPTALDLRLPGTTTGRDTVESPTGKVPGHDSTHPSGKLSPG